jgi:hypothetical protein
LRREPAHKRYFVTGRHAGGRYQPRSLATTFGLIFTPVFYVVCRWLAAGAKAEPGPALHSQPAE